MVSEVEFNRAFPNDRNKDGGHGSVLEGSKKIVGGSLKKSFEITCQVSKSVVVTLENTGRRIVDHCVTQYNQRLDEWMNAHTRR